MNREVHVRFCEGLGCNALGLLTYGNSDGRGVWRVRVVETVRFSE